MGVGEWIEGTAGGGKEREEHDHLGIGSSRHVQKRERGKRAGKNGPSDRQGRQTDRQKRNEERMSE